MIIYRAMKAEDSIRIYALFNSNLDGSFSLDVIEYFFLFWPEGQIVAEDIFGNIVGAICGTRVKPGRASIALYAVDSKYRGQGIGTKLLDNYRTRCYMEGFSEVQLEVRVTNTRAIDFYKRQGFAIEETLPSLYAPGEDGYRMVLKLSGINHVSS